MGRTGYAALAGKAQNLDGGQRSLEAISAVGRYKLQMDSADGDVKMSVDGGAFFVVGSALGPGGTLQQAYTASAGTVPSVDMTAAFGAIQFRNNSAANSNAFEVVKNPGGIQSGNGIDVTMGATTTGGGLVITQQPNAVAFAIAKSALIVNQQTQRAPAAIFRLRNLSKQLGIAEFWDLTGAPYVLDGDTDMLTLDGQGDGVLTGVVTASTNDMRFRGAVINIPATFTGGSAGTRGVLVNSLQRAGAAYEALLTQTTGAPSGYLATLNALATNASYGFNYSRTITPTAATTFTGGGLVVTNTPGSVACTESGVLVSITHTSGALTTADTTTGLTISMTPGVAGAVIGQTITMGANASGNGLTITHAGTAAGTQGLAISMTGAASVTGLDITMGAATTTRPAIYISSATTVVSASSWLLSISSSGAGASKGGISTFNGSATHGASNFEQLYCVDGGTVGADGTQPALTTMSGTRRNRIGAFLRTGTFNATGTYSQGLALFQQSPTLNGAGQTLTLSTAVVTINHAPVLTAGTITDTSTGLAITMTPTTAASAVVGQTITMGANASGNGATITHAGTGTGFLVNHTGASGNIATVQDGSSIVLNVIQGGVVIVGGNTSTAYGRLGQLFEINTTANFGGAALNTWSTTAGESAILDFNRSDSATIGAQFLVDLDDQLGIVVFRGSDSNAFINAAYIRADVDGNSGVNDMPGRLVFGTTADGSSSASERMRITNNGNVGINQTVPTALMHVTGAFSGTQTALKFGKNDNGYSNPFTSLGAVGTSTDVIFSMNQAGSDGGCDLFGFTDADASTAFYIQGHIGAATTTVPAVLIRGWKLSGTTRTALTTTEQVFGVSTGTTQLQAFLANGTVQWLTGLTYTAASPELLGPSDTDMFLSAGAATGTNAGRVLTLTGGAASTTGAGGNVSYTAGAAAGTTGLVGGVHNFTGGVGSNHTSGTAGAGGGATFTGGAAGTATTGIGGQSGSHTIMAVTGGLASGAAGIGGQGSSFTFTGGIGGAATDAASGLGGAGGTFSITAGAGGASTGSTGGVGGGFTVLCGVGGAGVTPAKGGSVNLTGGVGGAGGVGGGDINIAGGAGTGTVAGGSIAITSGGGASGTAGGAGGVQTFLSGAPGTATTGTAGAGGTISIAARAGGAATGAAGIGGAGSAFSVTGGIGGAATDAASGNAGAGGAITLTNGAGGASTAATGGAGGAFTLAGGAGGSGTTGGTGGGLTLTLGAAGSGGNVAGGSVTVTCGASIGTTTGGSFSLTSGAGANGTVGGNGGNFTIVHGVPGTATTSTAGSGGILTVDGRTGGAASGSGGSGGTGNIISFTCGAGGANTGAVATGTGGNGGRYELFTGSGGAATVPTTGTGGPGGACTTLTGNGGASKSATGGVAGAITLTTGNGGANSTAGTGGDGGAITLVTGGGGNGATTGGMPGSFALTIGNAGTGGNAAGGNVTFQLGTRTGTGAQGQFRVRLSDGATDPIIVTNGDAVTVATASGALGFYGLATPISRGAAVADASGGVVVDAEARTAINSLLARVRAVNLIAT